MISGWTASSRDSSKTEEGKAPRGYGQIRSELRMSSKLKLSRILPLKGQNPPGALCLPLPKSYHLSGERPSGYHSLLLRRKMSAVSPSPGRFSPERKTPPGVSAPSAGLRPLIVSRVKCGGGPCRGHSALPCTGKYDMPSMDFKKLRKILISACRKHVVAATGSSSFKVGDNQRPERTMSGAAKTSA